MGEKRGKRGSTPQVQVKVLNWRDMIKVFRDTSRHFFLERVKISIMIIFVALLFSGLHFGQEQIRAPGRLKFPGAIKNKYYKGMITITKETITIECDKKLFRAFNEFDTPRKKKLTISIEKVNRIHLQTYEVLIVPVTSLYERYRNLFHDTRYMSFWDVVEEKTLIFVLDDYEDITREGIDKLLTGIPLKQPGLWQIVCKIDYFAPLCVLYKVLIERFNQQEVTPGAEQSESL